jgi:hypothetical protein
MKSCEMLGNFEKLRSWVEDLRNGSKELRGFGYTVEYNEVNHRQLGPQSLPIRVVFETAEDFLKLIRKESEYARFRKWVEVILGRQPLLREWIERYPSKIIAFENHWPQLLNVCDFFQRRPRPDRYLRELDIPGVDTKFIEQHKSILVELLDRVLPPEDILQEATGLSNHGFERRYGLRYEGPLIRFRILDEKLMDGMKLDDLTVPLETFKRLSLPCKRVFITENKLNGLTFPAVSGSIVVFGLGYGIQTLKVIDWLKDKQIFYWGDIDTHGFSILSQMRGYYSQTESFLMDRVTLLTFRELWVPEDDDKRCTSDPACLTDDERALYIDLKDNILGKNVRLEQERIAYGYVCDLLETIQCRTLDRTML